MPNTYCLGIFDVKEGKPFHILCYRKGCKKYDGLCKMHWERLHQDKAKDLPLKPKVECTDVEVITLWVQDVIGVTYKIPMTRKGLIDLHNRLQEAGYGN